MFIKIFNHITDQYVGENKKFKSYKDLASLIKINASTISLIKNNKINNPSSEILENLSVQFELPRKFLGSLWAYQNGYIAHKPLPPFLEKSLYLAKAKSELHTLKAIYLEKLSELIYITSSYYNEDHAKTLTDSPLSYLHSLGSSEIEENVILKNKAVFEDFPKFKKLTDSKLDWILLLYEFCREEKTRFNRLYMILVLISVRENYSLADLYLNILPETFRGEGGQDLQLEDSRYKNESDVLFRGFEKLDYKGKLEAIDMVNYLIHKQSKDNDRNDVDKLNEDW